MVDPNRPLGRAAAGEAFFAALRRHAWAPIGLAGSPDMAAQLAEAVPGPVPVQPLGPRDQGRYGTLFVAGPGLETPAWNRTGAGATAYSICGITHTTATLTVYDALARLPLAPVRPWDAVICTSRAVRDMVARLVEGQTEWLRANLGATRITLPQFPVIPLGVDTAACAFTADDRAAARQALGLADDEVAILYLGRLSYSNKAHPLPLYQAMARLAAEGRRVVLLECGWYPNPTIRRAYDQARATLCPDTPWQLLDGGDPRVRRRAWAAADIFVSLPDSLQETFGLTPVEAMAAGLPVVVSDWDGYRDTVRDGVDGFRIPTVTPAGATAEDLMDAYDGDRLHYQEYLAAVGQFVAVDIGATVRALAALCDDADLRRQMGEHGRMRAQAVFDWAVVLEKYRELWADLAERRLGAEPEGPVRSPVRPDPFETFDAWPTRRLQDDDRVVLAGDPAALAGLRDLTVCRTVPGVLPWPETCAALLEDLAAHGSTRVATLGVRHPDLPRPRLRRALVWLLKLGIIAIDDVTLDLDD